MKDLIKDLASKAGISPDLAEKGLGAILSFIQEKLPAETFSQVSAAVPNAQAMMDSAQTEGPSSAGGLLGSVTGVVGKLFGGGVAALAAKLTQLGFSVDQLQSFLPKVLEFFQSKLPADVVEKVKGLLPQPEEAAS